MDKNTYNPHQENFKSQEWDTVEEKVDVLKNIKLGDALAWGVAGAILALGLWQSAQPIRHYPEERCAA